MKNMDVENGVVETERSYTSFLSLTSPSTRFVHKIYSDFILVFCSARGPSVSFRNMICNYCIMSGRSMILTIHLHRMLRSRMSRAVPLIPLIPLIHTDSFTFYLYKNYLDLSLLSDQRRLVLPVKGYNLGC
jgi:hypothetical protein